MTLPSDPRLMIPILRTALPKLMAQEIVGVQPMSAGAVFAPYIPKVMTKSKYKFSRANWYVAEFEEKYYWEVEAWCTVQFGPHPRHPDAWSRWVHQYESKIHFRDEKDYVLFCLRWS